MTTHLDHDRPRQERVKCVVVGDSGVGKTRLICARAKNTKYTLRDLCGPHIPTVWAIDQYHQHQDVLENSWEIVDGVSVTLRLWDTFGCHDKDRKFAFGRSDVVVLCFSVINAVSLRHCIDKWLPEIRRFCPKTPVILVGCRNDMRHLHKDPAYFRAVPDERRRVKETDILMPERGRVVAQQIGAVGYYETSVLSGFGVRTAFTNAIRAALVHRRQSRFWTSHLRHVQDPEFQSPFLVPPPAAPESHSGQSTYLRDLAGLTDDDRFFDVQFVCGDGQLVNAHKLLLASASDELDTIMANPADEMDLPSCFSTLEDRDRVRVIHLASEYSSTCLHQLMTFIYTGSVEMEPETVKPLQSCAIALGLLPLAKVITNRLVGEETEENNQDIIKAYRIARSRRLGRLLLEHPSKYSDVVFEVDDGRVSASRSLLSARSSYMSAMFAGNFGEIGRDVVPVPGIDCEAFKHCLYFLYTDQCPEPVDVWAAMEVVAAADRFCLTRLLDLVQEHIVKRFLTSAAALNESKDDQIAVLSLELLEPAEVFHAMYLYQWCANFIITHYTAIHRNHLTLLRSLTPVHQAMLSRARWPPAWYITEYDLYEYSLERRRMEMLQAIRKRRSRFPHVLAGCDSGNPHVLPRRPRHTSEPPGRRNGSLSRWRMLICSR